MPACDASYCSLRRLEGVLDRVDVPSERQVARVVLQERFDERIPTCLSDESSLGVVFRGRPYLFFSCHHH